MANGLETKLDLILSEKESKIIPENIREGVTIFGVEGELASESIITEEDYNECLTIAYTIMGNVYEKTYLYQNGTFNLINTFNPVYYAGTTYTTFTTTPEINIILQGTYSSGSEYLLVSDTKIDFTNIHELEITLEDTNIAGTSSSVYNFTEIALEDQYEDYVLDKPWSNRLYYSTTNYSGTLSLDVSDITGEKYIIIRPSCRAYSWGKSLKITSIAVIGEKNTLVGGEM